MGNYICKVINNKTFTTVEEYYDTKQEWLGRLYSFSYEPICVCFDKQGFIMTIIY